MNSIQTLVSTGLMIIIASPATLAQNGLQWDAPGAITDPSPVIKIKDQVDVTVEIPGKLIELSPGFVGGRVKKGDLVMKLNSETVKAELAELELLANSDVLIDYAQSKLNTAEKKLLDKSTKNEKSMKEFGHTIYNDEEIERLELEVLEAKAELAKSKQDKVAAGLKYQTKLTEVKQYTVYSPMDGVVTDLHAKANGSGVRQGDPIMTIVNLAEVTAELKIPGEFESLVTLGDRVIVRRTGHLRQPSMPGISGAIKTSSSNVPVVQRPDDDIVFEGEVVFIVPEKESGGALKVEAVIKNKFVNRKYLLRKGSKIEAQIIPASHR